MNVETITSRQNPLMTHLRKLASSRSYRKKSGEYLCDGTKLLDEALKWGAPVQTVVFSDGVTWSLDDLLSHMTVNGGTGNDSMAGTAFADRLSGGLGSSISSCLVTAI